MGRDKTKDKSNISGSQSSNEKLRAYESVNEAKATLKHKETSQGTSGTTQISIGKAGQELDSVKTQDTIDSVSKENDNKNQQKESAKIDWNDLLDSEEDIGS